MANKKENIKNLVKRMFLSISIMSFFVSAGIENASAMEQNSIFGEAHKRKSDSNNQQKASPFLAPIAANNNQQNTAPISDPMTTNQPNSGYRLVVPAPPISDKNTGVSGVSKIMDDAKKKSGNGSNFFANGKNPIPFILEHYKITHSKEFTPKAIPPTENPKCINEYLAKYDCEQNYKEITELANGIDSNAINDVDVYNDVKRYSDGCLLPVLKEVALRNDDKDYVQYINMLQSDFSNFLYVSCWSYIEQDPIKGVEQFAEMCFKASKMIDGECGDLLWNISLLGNNINAIACLYDDSMPSNGVITEKRIQAANVLKNFISNIEDGSPKKVLDYFRTLCINEIRNDMNTMLGDLL